MTGILNLILSCILVACVKASKEVREDSWIRSNLVSCLPYDSCQGRCADDEISHTLDNNITLAYFNCFCNENCMVFGDCCSDYHDECNKQKELEIKMQQRTKKLNSKEMKKRFDCIHTNDISEDYSWMVSTCQKEWSSDYTKHLCETQNQVDMISRLPVTDEKGWTYKNVFCARCNHVTIYQYWSLLAHCRRSAPKQVLSGDPVLLSYYLRHFCSVEIQQKMKKNFKIFDESSSKKIRRTCNPELISSCPAGYKDQSVVIRCKSYQAIVIAKEKGNYIIFKNSHCALCHGYSGSDYNSSKTSTFPIDEAKKTLQCPVWIKSKNYDQSYWLLSVASVSYKLLPYFNYTFKTSKWVPPSFSIMMQFREEHTEVIYDDETESSLIPNMSNCSFNEVYDPLSGVCRTIYCSEGLTFTSEGCVKEPKSSDTSFETDFSENGFGTITVQIEVKVQDIGSESHEDMKMFLMSFFENHLNTTIKNLTVVAKAGNGRQQEQQENEADDESHLVSISFLLLKTGSYNSTNIIELIERISETINFDKIDIAADDFGIVILETSSSPYLQCSNGSIRQVYNSSEFEIKKMNEENYLYHITSDKIYKSSDYQLLDWTIDITYKPAEVKQKNKSRAAVCVKLDEFCANFLSLNLNEFIILENGSIFILNKNSTIQKKDYVLHQDGAAVCVDYLFEEQIIENKELSMTALVMSWVVFVLTLIALLVLVVTFIIYAFISELRTISGCCIMNLVAGLFTALLTFTVGANRTDNVNSCIGISIILHYLFLTTFFWNNVMAYDVWLTFGHGFNNTFSRSQLHHHFSSTYKSAVMKRTLLRYMTYAWGIPAVIVGICIVVEFTFDNVYFGYQPNLSGIKLCWISNPFANLLAFGLPLALILLLNSIFFMISTVSIRKTKISGRMSQMLSAINHNSKSVNHTVCRLKQQVNKHEETVDTAVNVTEKPATDAIPNEIFVPNKVSCSTAPCTKSEKEDIISTNSKKYTPKWLIRMNLMLYVRLSTLMGFTWTFGFAAAIVDNTVLWYIFEISVPFQGILIFVSFVCKPRVYNLVKKRLKAYNSKQDSLANRPKAIPEMKDSNQKVLNSDYTQKKLTNRQGSQT